MMDVLFLLVVSFLSYHLGKLSGKLSIHPRWGRFWEPSATETLEVTEEATDEIDWQHDRCGTDVDHDAEFCHVCGEEIDTFTDSAGVDHDGLPMWKLGEN
jgi:hypothetical protein